MFHLLILAIIETLYIDIQIFVYLNDGKTIIFGKASFYHPFIVNSGFHAENYSSRHDGALG